MRGRNDRSVPLLRPLNVGVSTARHAQDEVTEDMNAVVRRLGESSTDPFVEGATRRALKKVEW